MHFSEIVNVHPVSKRGIVICCGVLESKNPTATAEMKKAQKALIRSNIRAATEQKLMKGEAFLKAIFCREVLKSATKTIATAGFESFGEWSP